MKYKIIHPSIAGGAKCAEVTCERCHSTFVLTEGNYTIEIDDNDNLSLLIKCPVCGDIIHEQIVL